MFRQQIFELDKPYPLDRSCEIWMDQIELKCSTHPVHLPEMATFLPVVTEQTVSR